MSTSEYEELNYPYFSDELVIITLKTEVEYSRAVRPVCIDVGPYNFEKAQVIKGAMPKMSCWGENATLKIAEMNYVPRGECGNQITSSYYGFLSAQKICVKQVIGEYFINKEGETRGAISVNVGGGQNPKKLKKSSPSPYGETTNNKRIIIAISDELCRYPVGGGLVFEDPKTKTYYLRAINTVAHSLTGTIPFTKLTSRKDMVEKYLDDCKRVCRRCK